MPNNIVAKQQQIYKTNIMRGDTVIVVYSFDKLDTSNITDEQFDEWRSRCLYMGKTKTDMFNMRHAGLGDGQGYDYFNICEEGDDWY